MITRGERNDLIEVVALDPELVFAGRVAGVLAAFEHGDDYDLDRDRLAGCCGLSKKMDGRDCDYDQNKNESLKPAHESPSS